MIRSSRSAVLSIVGAHPFKKPPPRPIPFALKRVESKVQRFRGLFIGQSQEKLQLDDRPLPSRHLVQFVEERVNSDCHFQRRTLADHALGKSIHGKKLDARPPARMVDEKTAHDPSRYSEEMTAIPPVDIPGAGQTEKGLVYERGRLQGVTRRFSAEAAAGDLAQIRHQRFKQRWFRLRVPLPPAMQKKSDFPRAASHAAPPG